MACGSTAFPLATNVSVILTRIAKPYPDEGGGGLFERIANWFE